MTNVAEYGFEGRLEAWAENERYFDYSKAANPIGSRPDFQDPIKAFGGELYAVAALLHATGAAGWTPGAT
jgi:hypothetical protein